MYRASTKKHAMGHENNNGKGAQTYNVFRPPQPYSMDGSIHPTSQEGNNVPLSRSSTGSTSRKRPRTAAPEPNYDTPYSSVDASWASLNPDLSRSIGTASPPPLVNAKYRLAGGLDTPTQEAAAQYEALDNMDDGEFRRRWTSDSIDETSQQRTIVVGALERERNGGRRAASVADATQETWGQFVYNVVGGVAGKVWEFCRASAFSGFTAGGGTGYQLTPSAPKRVDRATNQEDWGQRATPVPGQYPEDDYDQLRDSDLETRPAKRLQTSQGKDWVVVNPSPVNPLKRRTFSSQMSYSASPARRHVSEKASHARASGARRPRTSTARLSLVSDAGSPHTAISQGRSASFASPRSHENSPQIQRSPATAAAAADVQKYTAKRQREERQADASMKKLNQQLKMMIRQGKEALASTVEVQEDELGSDDAMEDDEEFGEASYYSSGRAW